MRYRFVFTVEEGADAADFGELLEGLKREVRFQGYQLCTVIEVVMTSKFGKRGNVPQEDTGEIVRVTRE